MERTRTEMERRWNGNGTEMKRKGTHRIANGTKMEGTCNEKARTGTQMEQTWNENETELEQKGTNRNGHGTQMERKRHENEPNIN